MYQNTFLTIDTLTLHGVTFSIMIARGSSEESKLQLPGLIEKNLVKPFDPETHQSGLLSELVVKDKSIIEKVKEKLEKFDDSE